MLLSATSLVVMKVKGDEVEWFIESLLSAK
jgi:hypothetical protein